MKESTKESIEEKAQRLKAIIVADTLQEYDKSRTTFEFDHSLLTYLTEEEGTLKVKPWLKARLFETTLALKGMDTYLRDLLRYDKDKPEDEVPINSPLASFLISTALNTFTLELVKEIVSKKTVTLSRDQIDALSHVFRPNRDYTFPMRDITFESNQIQNIRSSILRRSLDILSSYKQGKYADRLTTQKEFETVPKDLERVTYIPDVTIEQLFSISKKYGSQLKISLMDGYLVWRFRDQPAIYIKDGEAYYSPKFSKRREITTIDQADRQVYYLMEQLEASPKPVTRCLICNKNSTSQLYFHVDKGVIPVCKECSKDSKIVGIVSQMKPKLKN